MVIADLLSADLKSAAAQLTDGPHVALPLDVSSEAEWLGNYTQQVPDPFGSIGDANNYQEAQAMVSVGLGVALAPLTAMANKRSDIRVISLGSSAPSRRVLLALREEGVRSERERVDRGHETFCRRLPAIRAVSPPGSPQPR